MIILCVHLFRVKKTIYSRIAMNHVDIVEYQERENKEINNELKGTQSKHKKGKKDKP